MTQDLGLRTWKTRDGRVLQWKDMETSHIYNCIELLKRRAAHHDKEAAAALSYDGHGEQALHAASEHFEHHGRLVTHYLSEAHFMLHYVIARDVAKENPQ